MSRNLLRTGILAVRWSARHLDYNTVQYSIVHCPKAVRCFTTSSVRHHFFESRDKDHEEKEKQLIVHQGEYFDKVGKQERNRQTFQKAVNLYLKQNSIYRRGHVEFLYAALDHMTEFDAQKDLTTYKKLLTLFPENKMIASGPWEVEWMYYPKQQQCCIDIMDFMETHGKFYVLVINYILVLLFAFRSSIWKSTVNEKWLVLFSVRRDGNQVQ